MLLLNTNVGSDDAVTALSGGFGFCLLFADIINRHLRILKPLQCSCSVIYPSASSINDSYRDIKVSMLLK